MNRPSSRRGRSRPPQIARTDANQAGIVRALRQAGCSVAIPNAGAGFPDLVVGRTVRGVPTTWLMEIKTETGKLNAGQVAWHQEWRGHVAVVRTVEQALEIVGVYAGLRGGG